MKKLAILALATAGLCAALPSAASAHPHFVPGPAPHFHAPFFHPPFFHAPFFHAHAFFPVPVPVLAPAYYPPAPVYAAPVYGYPVAPVYPVPVGPSVSFHAPGVSVRFGF